MPQIPQSFSTINSNGMPQRLPIECTSERIGKAKRQHKRNPTLRELKRPTTLVHLVLLNVSTAKMVHGAFGIALLDERVGRVGPLLAFEDVEVVVGGVAARVALRTQRRAKHNQILCYRRVDQVHAAHCAAGVVEDPFVLQRRHLVLGPPTLRCGCLWIRMVRERVGSDVIGTVGFAQRRDYVVDYTGGRVWV